MNILVTGGAGFIGSHIVDNYVAQGHTVTIVDNLVTGSRKNLNPSAEFVEMDICSDELGSVFERVKPDAVMHLAAQIDVRMSVENPIFDAQSNILGSINVLQNCVDHKVGKFIFASTGGAIYGNVDALPVSEEVIPMPVSHYGTSKLSVEHYIYLYHVLYGLRHTVLRFPNVYGPRQSPHGEAGVCSILTGLMLQGKTPTLFGFGKAMRDYVYVGDIARAAVLALDTGDSETLNLGSNQGTSVMEIFELLRDLLSFEQDPVLKPLRPGEIDSIYITGDKAKAVLGWEPQVDMRQGLANLIEHIREHGI
ncbi:MAG: NAD-dependent epimerase/dehydratase family protein [bacterium]|nr:NAD-dependent epimerase/dehydratase family protein [bacterium]